MLQVEGVAHFLLVRVSQVENLDSESAAENWTADFLRLPTDSLLIEAAAAKILLYFLLLLQGVMGLTEKTRKWVLREVECAEINSKRQITN